MSIHSEANPAALITLPTEYASRIDVIETNVGKAIRATQPIAKGTHLYPFAGKILNAPNMHTVQLDANRHILCVGGPEFTAHSCDPNAYFMFVGDAVTLVAIKDIGRGDLISFNYCTTEWDMAEKFPCACKAEHCFGWIKGFSHCNPKQREILMPYLSPYIRSKADAAPVAALPVPGAQEKTSESSSPKTPTTESPTAPTRSVSAAPSLSTEVAGTALSTLNDDVRSRIEIVETSVGIGKAIQTTTFIPKGTALYPCMGSILDAPDMWTVQLDEKRHIMCLGGPAFTAHACEPNAFFQFGADSMTLVAIKDIQPLELVTFNYCTTEWHMSAPFKCICKSPNCLGEVRGISHVTEEKHKQMMLPYLSPYIRAKALRAGMITAAQAEVVFDAKSSAPASPSKSSSSPIPADEDKRSSSPSASSTTLEASLSNLSVTPVSVTLPGATVPANLYGATAVAYSNNLTVINNSGSAVLAGASGSISGHMD